MDLKYKEVLLLALYNAFFGEDYPIADKVGNQSKTDLHVIVEKMCFLLQLKGISVGDYNYSWNCFGPFSPGLLATLRSIDSKKEQIKKYNSSNEEDKISVPKGKIQSFTSAIKLLEHSNDKKDWLELLGSIAYISNYVLPGEEYDLVQKELVNRKERFKDDTYNKKAWNALKNAGLLELVS